MVKGSDAAAGPTALENEFVPPIDMPEVWGPTWARQMAVVEAWQAACAGEAAAAQDELSGVAPDMRAVFEIRGLPERRRDHEAIGFPNRRAAA